MELLKLLEQYKECTDTKRAYVLLNMIKAIAGEEQEKIKPELLAEDLGSECFTDLGQTFSLIEMQKGTLDYKKIVPELSDAEIRAVIKPTEAMLKALGHKDLIEKYKTTESVRQIRVTNI